VKPVSLNFLQTLTETALQHILPTIFQYYTLTVMYWKIVGDILENNAFIDVINLKSK
jgi:hypothetical protein